MQIILARKYIPDYAKPCVCMSSGDFIYPSIIRNLLYSFPNAIFYSVYGLAELGGRFFINRINSNSDFLQYMCLGNKLSGMDYKIIANELHVRSNSQFSAYIKNDSLVYANEYHSTGDLILSNSGCLTLAGRHNDEIKIAGNKISLKTLEQKASIVFPDDIVLFIPVKHDTLGTLIAIVISSDRIYERKEVILSLRKVLEIYEIPHYIYMIHKIPYTQTMKIDRKWISKNISSLQAI
jgi:acyl-CoA synthetase (AMP-forming)/AMP-acid ligase II